MKITLILSTATSLNLPSDKASVIIFWSASLNDQGVPLGGSGLPISLTTVFMDTERKGTLSGEAQTAAC